MPPKRKTSGNPVLAASFDAAAFMRRHWQKKPLLVRGAFSKLDSFIDLHALRALALRDDVESRLISRRKRRWQLTHGPLVAEDFATLAQRDWTLLVQDVQHHLPAAWKLLRQFAFIPDARLDDLMISYAVTGGGVGPHYDSYDVFLVQAHGRRAWRIASKFDRQTRRDVPLKMIAPFEAEHEWVLEPGDMLYLPPGIAHDGIALDECITLSVGFRAPRSYELALAYLQELGATHDYGAMLRDPELKATRTPARIDAPLIARYQALLHQLDWRYKAFPDFLGRYLSEPKAHVEFEPPEAPLSARVFRAHAAKGLVLGGNTRLLYRNDHFYINGESVRLRVDAKALRMLANRRFVAAHAWSDDTMTALYEWYRCGYVIPLEQEENAPPK